MSPQEKRHGVMARIRTSDLTIKKPTLYHDKKESNLLLILIILVSNIKKTTTKNNKTNP
jgi:hypothetical protein